MESRTSTVSSRVSCGEGESFMWTRELSFLWLSTVGKGKYFDVESEKKNSVERRERETFLCMLRE